MYLLSNSLGSFVPEGTSAVVHTYSLHHDPRYFSPFPDAFIPERWLSSEEKLALEPTIFSTNPVIHNTSAFIPFSVGPSNCVGRNLASQVKSFNHSKARELTQALRQEMRMIICRLLTSFQLRFEEGFDADSWEENMLDYFVVQRGKLPVVLTPRAS
jgi:hypothetical protein